MVQIHQVWRRGVGAMLLGAAAVAGAQPLAGEPPDLAFTDRLEVGLTTLLVRVVDRRGNLLPGLGPDDFRVRVGGVEVPVAAVDWVAAEDRQVAAGSPATDSGGEIAAAPPGRLVLFFVQTDVNAVRTKGHLRTRPYAEKVLETLPPGDWIAVVSFDSHLKLWQDFTHDRDAVVRRIDRAIRFGARPPPPSRRPRRPSLTAGWDAAAARRAATPERALELAARALAPLPGEKVLVFLGWGLGRYGPGGVRMPYGYLETLRALREARATVFVLDVTDADFHSLETGLMKVAADTGGTYDKTRSFPAQAADRLARTLEAGYYVLSLDRSRLPSAGGRLRVELARRKGVVLVEPGAVAGDGGRRR